MVDSVRRANFFGVVQRCWAVSVGKDEDVRCREDLQSCLKSGSNEIGGLIAGNEESCILDVVLNLGFGGELGWWRVVLENNEEGSKGVAAASLKLGKVKIQ